MRDSINLQGCNTTIWWITNLLYVYLWRILRSRALVNTYAGPLCKTFYPRKAAFITLAWILGFDFIQWNKKQFLGLFVKSLKPTRSGLKWIASFFLLRLLKARASILFSPIRTFRFHVQIDIRKNWRPNLKSCISNFFKEPSLAKKKNCRIILHLAWARKNDVWLLQLGANWDTSNTTQQQL